MLEFDVRVCREDIARAGLLLKLNDPDARIWVDRHPPAAGPPEAELRVSSRELTERAGVEQLLGAGIAVLAHRPHHSPAEILPAAGAAGPRHFLVGLAGGLSIGLLIPPAFFGGWPL